MAMGKETEISEESKVNIYWESERGEDEGEKHM